MDDAALDRIEHSVQVIVRDSIEARRSLASHIVATDVPALVAALREARAEVADLRRFCAEWSTLEAERDEARAEVERLRLDAGSAGHACACAGIPWLTDETWARMERWFAPFLAAHEAEVRERIAAEQAAWECDDPWTCCVAAHRDIARQRERGQS